MFGSIYAKVEVGDTVQVNITGVWFTGEVIRKAGGKLQVTVSFYYSLTGQYHPKGSNSLTVWRSVRDVRF